MKNSKSNINRRKNYTCKHCGVFKGTLAEIRKHRKSARSNLANLLGGSTVPNGFSKVQNDNLEDLFEQKADIERRINLRLDQLGLMLIPTGKGI
jgi:hypothetical protein